MREEIRNKPSVSPGKASTPYSGSSNLDKVLRRRAGQRGSKRKRGNNNQQDKKRQEQTVEITEWQAISLKHCREIKVNRTKEEEILMGITSDREEKERGEEKGSRKQGLDLRLHD